MISEIDRDKLSNILVDGRLGVSVVGLNSHRWVTLMQPCKNDKVILTLYRHKPRFNEKDGIYYSCGGSVSYVCDDSMSAVNALFDAHDEDHLYHVAVGQKEKNRQLLLKIL